MIRLVIDQEKCLRDGICTQICPRKIIEQDDTLSVPSMKAGMEVQCIECGHCVAACPSGALSLGSMVPEECPSVHKEYHFSPEQTEHFLRSRRSIRVYRDKLVEKETIIKLIDIARFAPSGHNSQPVEWLVISNKAEVLHLAGLVIDWMKDLLETDPEVALERNMDSVVAKWENGNDTICRNAHHMIIVHAARESRTAPEACVIALSYLELAADSLGLGTCWAGYFNDALESWPPLRKAIPLPQGHVNYGAVMLGYPKYKYYRLPLRKEPKIVWLE